MSKTKITPLPQTTAARSEGGWPVRYLSLFSGVGAHDLGFERAGWQCCGQVEIDPFCRAVLAKHWPHVPRFEDVRDVSADDVVRRCGPIDLLTGGFACQDISAAGKGAGLTRFTRSGITFRNLFRLARQLRPAWLVIENVPALRTRGYDRCVRVLERIGYACRALVVSAGAIGAPHRRQRVWILANTSDERRSARTRGTTHHSAIGEATQHQPARSGDSLADTDGIRRAAEGDRGLSEHAHACVSGQVWPARPGEPQHAWEAPRLVESSLGGTASGPARRLDGFARRSSLKALGNANPPQVAELIARTINAAVKELRGVA